MNSCECTVCIRCKLRVAIKLLKSVQEHDDKIVDDDAWYAVPCDVRVELDKFLESLNHEFL